MKYIKTNGKVIFVGLVELLIGILLFIDPIRFTSGILRGVGVVVLVYGGVCLLSYFTTEPMQAALEQTLSKGLLMILLGGFLTFMTERAISVFPLLTHLYGIIILIVGVLKLQQCVDLLRLKTSCWYLAGINAVLAIAFAAVILSDPFETAIILWRVAAAALIVEALLDTVILILIGKVEEKIEKGTK